MQLLEAFGTAIEVQEESLHDVTAITGSGPAFLYYVYEEYIKAAKHLGLSLLTLISRFEI